MSSNPLSQKRIVDPILSGLAQGYVNNELVGTQLMPYAITQKEGGQIPIFGAEHFRIYLTHRGLRAASNRIHVPGHDKITVTLEEHDLEAAIDYREQHESDFDERANATDLVQMGLTLGLEYEIAQLATNPANYPSSNKITLGTPADKFSSPDSDPEGVIEDAKNAIANGIMAEPNTLLMSRSVFRALKRHPKLKAILASDRPRLVQMQDLQDIFEVQNIVIGNAQHLDDDGQRRPIWGNHIVLAYVAPGASTGEGAAPARRNAARPSYGYTLRRQGMPMVDTYVENGGKIEVVRSTDIHKPYLLGPLAGYLISNAV